MFIIICFVVNVFCLILIIIYNVIMYHVIQDWNARLIASINIVNILFITYCYFCFFLYPKFINIYKLLYIINYYISLKTRVILN